LRKLVTQQGPPNEPRDLGGKGAVNNRLNLSEWLCNAKGFEQAVQRSPLHRLPASPRETGGARGIAGEAQDHLGSLEGAPTAPPGFCICLSF
jgi:hypothetical protein